MPTVSPDYSKFDELKLIDYESGNKDGRTDPGRLSNKSNQQQGGGTINLLAFVTSLLLVVCWRRAKFNH